MQFKQVLTIIFSASVLFFSAVANAIPVNVNKASPEEIAESLKGIGPAKAEAIAKYCKATKCSKPSDLLEVKGIGEKILEKISSDLKFK